MNPSSPSEPQAAAGDRPRGFYPPDEDLVLPTDVPDDAQVSWVMEMHGNTITHLSVDGVTLIGQRHGDHNPTGKLQHHVREALVLLDEAMGGLQEVIHAAQNALDRERQRQ